MTDVVELAKERRARLATEIAKLDEFIHMAEMLVKYSPGKAKPGTEREEDSADKSGRPTVVRPYTAGSEGKG
jgi:hypothetical protein